MSVGEDMWDILAIYFRKSNEGKSKLLSNPSAAAKIHEAQYLVTYQFILEKGLLPEYHAWVSKNLKERGNK